MRCLLTLIAVASLWLAGCEAQSVPVAMPAPSPSAASMAADSSTTTDDPAADPLVSDPVASDAPAASDTPALTTEDAPLSADPSAAPAADASTAADAPAEAKPVAVADGAATLSPENTKIQFVGLHSGDKPDPRTGGFAKFSGQAQVDGGKLKSVSVDIDTTSLFTEIQKLTDHLKSPDFFEVNEFPTAKFESTKIEAGDAGQAAITGNLTLHGVTKEISFPATVQAGAGGLSLTSEFDIDRTQFGMTFGEGKVENKVSLSVVVGEKTLAK